MTDLRKYVGRRCQIKQDGGNGWINGKLDAVYSEIVSFNGYPFNRTGLQIRLHDSAEAESCDDGADLPGVRS